MPTLNNRGHVVGGQGDGVVSINRVRIAGLNDDLTGDTPAGGRVWVDDDTILYQTYENGQPILQTYHVPTKKKTKVSNRGANFLGGGGGRWIAHGVGLDGITGGYGIRYDSHNMFYSERGSIVDVGRDGTFCLNEDYQSDGYQQALYALDGRRTALPDEPLFSAQVLGPTSLIWVPFGGGEFRTLNARVPKQAGNALSPKVCRVGNEDWVVYYSDKFGLICHPFDELMGYVLDDTGHSFWHDAMSFNNTIRVTYAHRAGEAPQDVIIRDLNLDDTRVDFSAGRISVGDFRVFTESASGGVAVVSSGSAIKPQLSLLEDDIVYRLALLAVNILQPLKNKFPNIVVRSGFREVNSGISQHELGEAVDIQITNQTPALLFDVANYIKNKLPFDQLILNYTNAGDGQPWIHVSFSPTALRGQVLTKDMADVFYEGLYLVTSLTGEDAAAALRQQSTRDAEILAEMSKLQKRQDRLFPQSKVGDEAPAVAASGVVEPGTGGGGGTGSGNVHGRGKLVACVQAALNLPKSSDEATNIANAFEVTKRVAWLLRDEGCGLLIKNGGENIISWNGYSFSAGRVCFSDGQLYKILSDVEGGTHAPHWDDNGIIDQAMYVPAMDPGAGINMNWMQCYIAPDPTSPTPPPNPENTGGGGGRRDEDGNPGRETA